MRRTTEDSTLERNYIQKYQFLVQEYEQVKLKQHPRYRFVTDFYKAHKLSRQTFLKYYHRYLLSKGDSRSFLPRKRGPRWHTRRTMPFIEQKVLELRDRGINRYEINSILQEKFKSYTPSPSTIYKICKRHGVNRLTPKMTQTKRKIIKQRAGELIHIDTHYLSKGILEKGVDRYYVVGLIDSCTRIAWAEVIPNLKSITVMFATMRCFQVLQSKYGIKAEEVLTDNGPEFGTKDSKKKDTHPFERMLMETGVKHRYIKPYRPQTNGKIERFWRTLEEDMLAETSYEHLGKLEQELYEYLHYYNEHRPHSGIKGQTPLYFLQNLSTK